MSIDVKLVLENAPPPILATFEVGSNVTDVKLVLANAESSIIVTELGIVIDVKPEHASNADTPILVTVLGIVIDVICVLSANAPGPILEYPCIITVVAEFRLASTIA